MTNEAKRSEESASTAGLDTVAFMLFLETWLDDGESLSEMDGDLLRSLHWKWLNQWLPARFEAHCGDCTKVSAPCTRCGVERIYEDAERILKVSNA